MGESAEFEKLTMLEARLAAALDRISNGMVQVLQAPAPLEDPGITSGALEDAEMRAASAEAREVDLQDRIAALEGRLAETQDALAEAQAAPAPTDGTDLATSEIASIAEERDRLAARVQALEVSRKEIHDELQQKIAAKDAEIEQLRGELANAADAQLTSIDMASSTEDAASDGPADWNEQLESFRGRVRKLRIQRAEARAERDEAKDLLEELEGKHPDPDARLAELRSQVVQLKTANDDLLESLAELRSLEDNASVLMDEAMLDEIAALKAARAAEAAELARILDDLQPILMEGASHA